MEPKLGAGHRVKNPHLQERADASYMAVGVEHHQANKMEGIKAGNGLKRLFEKKTE